MSYCCKTLPTQCVDLSYLAVEFTNCAQYVGYQRFKNSNVISFCSQYAQGPNNVI